jgi:plasmid stabilization system protein ParE
MALLPIEFLPEAIEEAAEARAWYASRSATAARRFLRELDRAVGQIREAPLRWPEHFHGTRRYRVARFPFLIVYRVRDDRIEIIACQHGNRRPGYWRERLNS